MAELVLQALTYYVHVDAFARPDASRRDAVLK